MTHSLRRASLLLAAPALALSALVAVPNAASAAPADHDPAPAANGAAWLTAQLTDGLLFNEQYQFDDVGLTIDAAFGLAAVGDDAAVDTIATAVSAPTTLSGYVGDGTAEAYAGATAKAAVLAQVAGDDPTSFGGVDLIDRLEGLVLTGGNTAGRIQDTSQFGDYANVVGQAYAVQSLDAAGSTSSDAATDFLLAQQCDGGWFRLYFSAADATDQTCDGDAASAPDTDATAIAVRALMTQSDDTDVAGPLAAAVAWLESVQKANGSFGGGTATEAANSNSTGLAGWVLGESGKTAAAEKAAVWVRQHQVVNVGGCTPYHAADVGSIAYDKAGLAGAGADGVTVETADQFRRATAQALPVLQWAPGGPDVYGMGWGGASPYLRGGSTVDVTVDGMPAGDSVCGWFQNHRTQKVTDADGKVTVPVKLPNRTGTFDYVFANSAGRIGKVTFKAVGPLVIPFGLNDAVARGGDQVVRVRGLEKGEPVSVRYRGHVVVAGKADRDGAVRLTLPVGRKLGPAEVTVLGQYGSIRHNTKTFRVTR